ncbi:MULTISPECIES: primosomal protein DnaI [unclassified Thermoactinomyces]|uniref:primosomal protein DnaI n=1 Tax=unclassified Thermoactinomyces TaxID=2634588 RepID=UPI0018DD9B1E|nr:MULTISPECIES: primosomal protein DnaI [unclassified Thermoactinomyces]MBH8602912.1 primosomal protein DnaI [Thermoactinomyces sp. CICC 10522]MBH8607240.1 primosomal protein DnaI [Thermoactinomyces sp. CICC 10521]
MKKLGNVISSKMKERFSPDQMERQLNALLKHPLVVKYMVEHEVSEAILKRSFSKLHQFVQENENCKQCLRLSECPNLMKGHFPTLREYGGFVDLVMNECSKLKAKKEEERRKNLIQCQQIPLDIQKATFQTIELDHGREKAIDAALDFCLRIANGETVKGLYFCGSFGTGKSYIAGAILNTLAEYGIPSMMVHTSALAQELRDTIAKKEGLLNSKLEALSNVPILVLDDIGVENLTSWLRDSVLAVVLHNRVSNQLPTIYTSNLTLDELEEWLSITLSNGYERHEPLKAKRIMERIKPYVTVVEVQGRNRRYALNNNAN